jgi:Holliday junction resolvasome RuvABC endonuclease subunit
MSNIVDDIQKELEQTAIRLEHVNILFLDPSSTCTGYTLAEVNYARKTAKITKTGVIWFDKNWTNQDKYHYLFRAITVYFNIIGQIDYCFAEAYMVNPKKMQGCLVSPEIHGAIQVALAEIEVKYKAVPAQSWRAPLGIRATKDSSGKKDFKTPTADVVAQYIKLPEKITSNITGMQRSTPHDLTDAIAICIGCLKKIGIKHFDFKDTTVQEDFTQVV